MVVQWAALLAASAGMLVEPLVGQLDNSTGEMKATEMERQSVEVSGPLLGTESI